MRRVTRVRFTVSVVRQRVHARDRRTPARCSLVPASGRDRRADEVFAQRFQRRIERRGASGALREHRRRATPQKAKQRPTASATQARRRWRNRPGARELDEERASARGTRPPQDLAAEVSLEQPRKSARPLRGARRAAGEHQGGLERQRACRVLRGGCERQAAAERATVADRGMRDLRRRLRKQRRCSATSRERSSVACVDDGARCAKRLSGARSSRARAVSDVDEPRARKPHIERWDQALAAARMRAPGVPRARTLRREISPWRRRMTAPSKCSSSFRREYAQVSRGCATMFAGRWCNAVIAMNREMGSARQGRGEGAGRCARAQGQHTRSSIISRTAHACARACISFLEGTQGIWQRLTWTTSGFESSPRRDVSAAEGDGGHPARLGRNVAAEGGAARGARVASRLATRARASA